MTIEFHTHEEDAEFYVAILALGLLRSMRTGVIPLEHGIWSLGRPNFWKRLEDNKVVSEKLLNIVCQLDELDLQESISSTEKAYMCIDELENELLTILKGTTLRESPLVLKTKVFKVDDSGEFDNETIEYMGKYVELITEEDYSDEDIEKSLEQNNSKTFKHSLTLGKRYRIIDYVDEYTQIVDDDEEMYWYPNWLFALHV